MRSKAVIKLRLLTALIAWMALLAAVAPTASAQTTAAASVSSSPGAEASSSAAEATTVDGLLGIGGPEDWTSRERLSSSLQVMLLLTVMSLAPAVLLMTTSFVRIVVVLGLVRQALGAQQLPPSQVITSIALFVTMLLMTPVWKQTYDTAIKPYSDGQIDLEVAFDRGVEPIRRFMADQIVRTENHDDVYLFLRYLPDEAAWIAEHPDDPGYVLYNAGQQDRLVPLQALLPAFMLSELKTAFLIGFQIYLPFVIIDIIVASVTISMGMLMLPPVVISLPFKLLLFVLLDGWRLVVEMLLESFAMFTA